MFQLYRRDIREKVRYELGIMTPVQQNYPNAQAGDQPTDEPWPDNILLNSTLDNCISELNLLTRFSGSNGPIVRSVPAASATLIGPMYFDFSQPVSGYTGTYQVTSISSVYWSDDGQTWTELEPTSPIREDREGTSYQSDTPSTPRRYYLSNYTFALIPAPQNAGTLRYDATLSMLAPTHDLDIITQIPTDAQPLIWVMMAKRICETKPDDSRYAARLQTIVPTYNRLYEGFRQWLATVSEDFRGEVTARPDRRMTIRRR